MKALLLVLLFNVTLIASIGKIYAIRGDAIFERESGEVKIKVGAAVEEKDMIKTGKHTKLQIIFSDQTIMTLGKNSEFKIEKYLYDKSKNSHAQFKMNKGVLKSVTGHLGKLNPHKFSIRTKNSTIGIRGTTFVLKVTDTYTNLSTIVGETFLTPNVGDSVHVVPAQKKLSYNYASSDVSMTDISEDDVRMQDSGAMEDESEDETALVESTQEKIEEDFVEEEGETTTIGNTNFDAIEDTLMDFTEDEQSLASTLSKVIVNSDSLFSYGYWSGNGVDTTPFAEGTETTLAMIANYQSNSIIADYSGGVVSVSKGVASTVGSITLNVDFGNNAISGNILLTDAQNQTWDVDIFSQGSNAISGNSFEVISAEISDGVVPHDVLLTNATISGTFYGTGETLPTAGTDGVAGTFSLQGTNNNTTESVSVDGSFGGSTTGG